MLQTTQYRENNHNGAKECTRTQNHAKILLEYRLFMKISDSGGNFYARFRGIGLRKIYNWSVQVFRNLPLLIKKLLVN